MIGSVRQRVLEPPKGKKDYVQVVEVTLEPTTDEDKDTLDLAYWFVRKHAPLLVRNKAGKVVLRFWNEI